MKTKTTWEKRVFRFSDCFFCHSIERALRKREKKSEKIHIIEREKKIEKNKIVPSV